MSDAYTVPDDGPALASEQDALDLIGQTYGRDVDQVVIPVSRLAPDLFRLDNGLLGAFLQKLVNYRFRVVIVGDIEAACARSTALRAFVAESNRGRHVRFVPDIAALAGADRADTTVSQD